MLRTALLAKLPLITCTTTDTLNAQEIIKFLSGAGVVGMYKKATHPDRLGDFTIVFGGTGGDYMDLMKQNVAKERTLVIVNPEETILEAFHAGEIPVPVRIMRRKLTDVFHVKPVDVAALLAALGGLTLKEVEEVCLLAMSAHEELTPASVRAVRANTTQVVPGVQTVSTEIDHYHEAAKLEGWLDKMGLFLLRDEIDYRLRPRGLLFAGLPGTGKTLGAKHVARRLGVSLFRLDVGALQSKYVGESEANLNRALSVISMNQPCVMLIDEVEKLFHGNDDSGVTQNLLAGLLWWLQEHRTQVLTVMTTNDKTKLPDELIRPGRIDTLIYFDVLAGDDISVYIDELLASLKVKIGVDEIEKYHINSQAIEHAKLTGIVLGWVRDKLKK